MFNPRLSQILLAAFLTPSCTFAAVISLAVPVLAPLGSGLAACAIAGIAQSANNPKNNQFLSFLDLIDFLPLLKSVNV